MRACTLIGSVVQDSEILKQRLQHVYWLGGSPCSGKSTITDLIHNQYGIEIYHVDEAVRTKFGPYDPVTQPFMYRWANMVWEDTKREDNAWDDAASMNTAPSHRPESFWDYVWMRPVQTLVDEVFQCYSEQLTLVLQDILESPSRNPMLVEGNSLLPSKVAPLIPDRSRALWMAPSAEFQRRMYPQRGEWVQNILSQCRNPDRALQNWMDRDIAFANQITQDVNRLGLMIITVTGERSIAQNLRTVLDHFALTV